ncbi:TIGR04222 domain-containing membrane protein [Streptomyces sp. CBMA156]|uniref:TIGR04222 domain-containing membrane protein n=1 Tax=Streptomyces sp. CBMA156 TaxID=1930280 RepID=UPI0016619968|nr:TIGR04222 domain-containing membrane protein [Streptomyces sp. CBMA156]MBD0670433.1 hypothetical protein [Streptomyces sp. CBMA156]MBD0675202.1 hypothetical protein [Streptomyces sp. CBMA156]
MGVLLVLLLGTAAGLAWARHRCHALLADLYRAERLAEKRDFDLDLTELACLAGTLADLTFARMHERGLLVASRSGDVTATTGRSTGDGFETAVLELLGLLSTRTRDLGDLAAEFDRSPEARGLRGRLAALGLVDDEKLLRRVREFAVWMPLVAAAVAVTGVVAMVWALLWGGPWGIAPPAFTALTAAALVINRKARPAERRSTAPGARVLAAARADDRPGYGIEAVATGGLSALPALHDLRICREASHARKTARTAAARSHTGSGSDGVGLGGACGGSGCGGCGGCGGGL